MKEIKLLKKIQLEGKSKKLQGTNTSRIGWIGQENSFPVTTCRSTSCIEFKKIEKYNLGVKIKCLTSKEVLQRAAIVDIIDLCTNRE